jgi:hypothetical protein
MSARAFSAIALTILCFYLFVVALPRLQQKSPEILAIPAFTSELWLLLWLTLLSSQTALAPQSLALLLLPLSLYLALSFDAGIAIVGGFLYLLTYVGFDMGYWSFIGGDPFYVSIVALRNLTLLILTFLVLRRFSTKLI